MSPVHPRAPFHLRAQTQTGVCWTIYVCVLRWKNTNMYIHIYTHVCMCSVVRHFPYKPRAPLNHRVSEHMYEPESTTLLANICHPYTREHCSIREHGHRMGRIGISMYVYCGVKSPTCKYKYIYLYMCVRAPCLTVTGPYEPESLVQSTTKHMNPRVPLYRWTCTTHEHPYTNIKTHTCSHAYIYINMYVNKSPCMYLF